MARHPGTADGGRPPAAIAGSSRRRGSPSGGSPGARLTAALAFALLAGHAEAAPADLPPWDPTGAQQPAPVPAGSTDAAAPAREAGARVSSSPEGAGPARAPGATTGPASTPPVTLSDELPPPPRDPNDAPFMRPPNNQFQGLPPRTRPDIRRGWSARRRFAVTLAPAFASFRLPFQGRQVGGRAPRLHGAGLNLELDVQVWRWIWVRAHGTYSGHPVDEVRVENSDMEVLQTAPRGTIHATGFGAGPVFALDLGRFLPLIEVGLGGLRIAPPSAGEKGHRGEACGDNRSCDIGLKCSAANVCEQAILPDLYFGAAVDLLVWRHFSLGAQFRYYSRLARGEITNFPRYLLGTIRFAVRF